MGGHGFYISAEHIHQIERVQSLIYQHSAALGRFFAAPVAARVIVRVALPGDKSPHADKLAVCF